MVWPAQKQSCHQLSECARGNATCCLRCLAASGRCTKRTCINPVPVSSPGTTLLLTSCAACVCTAGAGRHHPHHHLRGHRRGAQRGQHVPDSRWHRPRRRHHLAHFPGGTLNDTATCSRRLAAASLLLRPTDMHDPLVCCDFGVLVAAHRSGPQTPLPLLTLALPSRMGMRPAGTSVAAAAKASLPAASAASPRPLSQLLSGPSPSGRRCKTCCR